MIAKLIFCQQYRQIKIKPSTTGENKKQKTHDKIIVGQED